MNRMHYAMFTALFVSFTSQIFGADGYRRLEGIDVIHYSIGVTIDATDSVITGETGILVEFNTAHITQIPLDFGAMVVDAVTVDGTDATYTHFDEKLTVSLPGSYSKGTRALVTVRYHGQPRDGLFILKNKFGDRTIFADNFSNRAHHWFPGIDHPYDKATAEYIIVAPEAFDVIANGRLMETTNLQNHTKRTHWKTLTEIPTYCMVIGAATFSIIHAGSWNGIPVSYYLYPEDRENGIIDYERALQMLEFYSTLIGPYPYSKLALVQSTTRYGGMENASSIFFSERSIRGNKRGEGTVAHEIAHQWFGDSVTEADWHDVWLSEGFATYFGALFFERSEGRDRFKEIMKGSKERYLRANAESPAPIHDPGIKDLSDVLTGFHYVKGSWTLHMLRGVVGDTRFFQGIRDYYRTYRDSNAMTRDFQRVMEFHSGQSLDWFFQQWIYNPGHPVYSLGWKWNEQTEKAVITIEQTQTGTTYRMPMELEIYSGSTLTRKKITTNGRRQSVTVSMTSAPDRIVMDPDNWVLMEVIDE